MTKLNKAEPYTNCVWRTLINKYPAKCYVCNKYIANGVMIKWHAKEKLVKHISDCLG